MENFVLEQLYIFLAATYGGMLIGFIYDLYRVFRGVFKPGKIATLIQDFFFWIVIAGVAMSVLLFSASGQIRLFSFLGFSLGMILYYWAFSSIVIRIMQKALAILSKSIGKVLKIVNYPLKGGKTILRNTGIHLKCLWTRMGSVYHLFSSVPERVLKKAKTKAGKILKRK